MLPLLAASSLFCLAAFPASAQEKQEKQIPNRLINYPGFLADAVKVGELRAQRRLTEEEFLKMAQDSSTIILDARSAQKYQMLHISGAKNLSLPDITAEELSKVIPDKNTRVLIYCNNNFENAPLALPSKADTSSLNIYTFNTLYSYGYKNIYELGPLIDIKSSSLPFEGTLKNSPKQ